MAITSSAKDSPSQSTSETETNPAPAEHRSYSNPDQWVDAYADSLYRHALIRLRDPQTAEDLVQETFLAAWKSRGRFQGASSEKTWLFAILRNKMMDYFRKSSREVSLSDLDSLLQFETRTFRQEGWARGVWRNQETPKDWKNARESLANREFWSVMQSCLGKLPPNISRAFVLREIDALDASEVCGTLNISANNLWIMLHRARLALRHCLEKNWFEDEKRPMAPATTS